MAELLRSLTSDHKPNTTDIGSHPPILTSNAKVYRHLFRIRGFHDLFVITVWAFLPIKFGRKIAEKLT
jgi:hypothetical protein